MTDEQQTVKYISGLKYPIQERVILHDGFIIDEAHNKAIKIERLHRRALPFRRPMLLEEPLGGEGIHPSSTSVDQPPTQQTVKALVRHQQQPLQSQRGKKKSLHQVRDRKVLLAWSPDLGSMNVLRGKS